MVEVTVFGGNHGNIVFSTSIIIDYKHSHLTTKHGHMTYHMMPYYLICNLTKTYHSNITPLLHSV